MQLTCSDNKLQLPEYPCWRCWLFTFQDVFQLLPLLRCDLRWASPHWWAVAFLLSLIPHWSLWLKITGSQGAFFIIRVRFWKWKHPHWPLCTWMHIYVYFHISSAHTWLRWCNVTHDDQMKARSWNTLMSQRAVDMFQDHKTQFLVFCCNNENSLQVGEPHKHMSALWNANTLRCILNQSA